MSAVSESQDRGWMRQAFHDVQTALATKINLANRSIGHAGTQGGVNEDHWMELFRNYLPNRYAVSSGIIIDNHGLRSQQIDLVVYDNHYTPTLLDQQRHRYIPAEAVYAVFECKPEVSKGFLDYASEKAASVRRLHRTSVAITHAGGGYPPRVPFPIIAGILAPRAAWADGLGRAFQRHWPGDGAGKLDCGCTLEDGAFDNFDGPLGMLLPEGALIHFLFRLLAKLQSLGTVPAVDWTAYAAVFTSSAVVTVAE